MKWALRIFVAFASLGAIIWYSGGIEVYWEVITRMTWIALLLSLTAITLDRVLMTYKWIRLLWVHDSHLPLLKAMQIYCASMAWGLFLPATIGADAIRVVCTRRYGLNSSEVITSILVERVLGFLATPLLALASLILLYQLGSLDPGFWAIWWISICFLIGAMVGFWLSLSKRLFNLLYARVPARFARFKPFRLLQNFHATYQTYRSAKAELVLFFLLTLLEQLLAVLIFSLIAWGLKVEVSFLYMAAAVPLAFLVSRLPISIGGLGVFEGVFVLILSTAGVAPEESLSIALLGRLLQIISWLPWWLAYVIGNGSLRQASSELTAP